MQRQEEVLSIQSSSIGQFTLNATKLGETNKTSSLDRHLLLKSVMVTFFHRVSPLLMVFSSFRRFPQVLVNVKVASKPDLATVPAVAQGAKEVEQALGNEGRLVLRYSGTEPLCRVMVEGPEESMVRALAERLAETIRRELA